MRALKTKLWRLWAWKFIYWLALFLVPPTLGIVLDSALGLPKLKYSWALGVPLLLWSLTLSAGAGRALRKRGHSRETARLTPPDVLVTDGIYSCMRHPNQFSMSFLPLALSLVLGSPCGLALSGWALAFGLMFILRVEEPLVHREFCPEYCNYASRVPAVSLSPRCLIEAVKEFRSSYQPRRG